jgi:hypothetical protein
VFCKYFALCLCIFLCVSIFVEKKNVFALGMHLNSPMFVRTQCPISHTQFCTYAFERTLYGRVHSPYHTHTLNTNAIKRTLYVRSHAFLVLHMTLLGHPTPLPLSFPPTTVQLSSLLPHFSSTKLPKIQNPPPPITSTTTTASPRQLCTTTTLRRPSNYPISNFLLFFPP